jgi:hypothetical protein
MMTQPMKPIPTFRLPRLALLPLLLAVGWLGSGCGEEIDDFESQAACRDYCAKSFDCDNYVPTSAETDDCVADCRNAIEDECGNEHQAAANDQIQQCVDMGCTDFHACMVFDAAPECYGFVD